MRTQQFALYEAERLAPRGREFLSMDHVQEFVDGLRDTWWWDLFYINRVKRVEVARGDMRCRTTQAGVGWYEPDKNAGRMEFTAIPHERLVLHELSHVLASARYGGSQGHFPTFARVYLEVVSLVMGPRVYTKLKHEFDLHSIDYDAAPPESPMVVRA